MKFYLDRHTVHFISAMMHFGWVIALTFNPAIVFSSTSHMAMVSIAPVWVWAAVSAIACTLQVVSLPNGFIDTRHRQVCELIGSYGSTVWWAVLCLVFFSSGTITTGDTTYAVVAGVSFWASRYVPAPWGTGWKPKFKSLSSAR